MQNFNDFNLGSSERELLNIVKPVCAYRICFNIRKFKSIASSHDPRSLRWIRSFVAVHVYFFHAPLASSFIPSRGNISFTEQSFEEILMKWNFLLKEIKKIKRRYDKNFRRNYRRIYIFLFNNNNNNFLEKVFDENEDEYSWLLSLLSPNSLETFIIKGRFMTSHIFSNFY